MSNAANGSAEHVSSNGVHRRRHRSKDRRRHPSEQGGESASRLHQARLARQTAAANAQRPLEEGRERLGQYLARTAQSNVDLARGSPVEAAAKIAERAQRDHLTTLHGGKVAVWGHAANARARGRAALQGAFIDAGIKRSFGSMKCFYRRLRVQSPKRSGWGRNWPLKSLKLVRYVSRKGSQTSDFAASRGSGCRPHVAPVATSIAPDPE